MPVESKLKTVTVMRPNEAQAEVDRIVSALKTVYAGLDGLEIDLNFSGLARSREEVGMKIAQRHRFATLACQLEDQLRELRGESPESPADVVSIEAAPRTRRRSRRTS